MRGPWDWLIKGVEWVVIGLMAATCLLVFAEAVLRGAADRSLIVTDEAARYAMIWVAMLGSALLVAEDGHIRIDVLPASLPPRVRLGFRLLSQAMVLVFLAVLLVATLAILPEVSRDRTVTLGITMDAIYLALPIGAVLMMLFTLRNMAKSIQTFRRTPVAGSSA